MRPRSTNKAALSPVPATDQLVDLQSHPDHRRLPIARVGIKRLFYPFRVLDRRRRFQDVTGEFEVYVDLTHTERATHMSRFVEIINQHRGEVTSNTIESILKDVKKRLQARRAELAVSFPYFVEKHAPVSGEASLMRYDCRFWASLDRSLDFVLTVTVPVTTLCPCSKAISKASAHNQRSLVTVAIRFRRMVWIEEVIACVEASASAEVYTLLKRSDEKELTERAYERPRFAEDLVREVALRLDAHPEITWFTVETENLESIHAHSAYAFLKKDKRRSRVKRDSGAR